MILKSIPSVRSSSWKRNFFPSLSGSWEVENVEREGSLIFWLPRIAVMTVEITVYFADSL
jgi:hypothetical protein